MFSSCLQSIRTVGIRILLGNFPPQVGLVLRSDVFLALLSLAVCPDKEPGLQPWMPGHSEDHRVTIGYGRKVLLTTSATVHSIEILNGGKLDKSLLCKAKSLFN